LIRRRNWNFFFPECLYRAWPQQPCCSAAAAPARQQRYVISGPPVHQIFITVFNQTDINGNIIRGGEILRAFRQFDRTPGPRLIVAKVDPTKRRRPPAVPIHIDRSWSRPTWTCLELVADPTVAALGHPTVGGRYGCLLALALYYIELHWSDELSGERRNAAGPQTRSFTSLAGTPDGHVSSAAGAGRRSVNVYLTPAVGASGSGGPLPTGVNPGTTATVSATP